MRALPKGQTSFAPSIRSIRSALLAAFLKEPHPKLAKTLLGIGRYERKAFARQKRLLRKRAKPE